MSDLETPPPGAAPADAQRGGGFRNSIKPLLILAVGLLSFRSAVADWNHVPSGSMKPTILEGDRIFVNKLAYDLRLPFTRVRLATWGAPQRGDVVVFLSPADDTRLVKRVIGVPGDVVSMVDHQLIVNDQLADYQTLDPETVGHLEPGDIRIHRFAEESFDHGPSHSIMTELGPSASPYFEAMAIPAGHYLVLGDNRDDSADSRVFGTVPGNAILGRATAVALSVDPARSYLPRWDRFFRGLP